MITADATASMYTCRRARQGLPDLALIPCLDEQPLLGIAGLRERMVDQGVAHPIGCETVARIRAPRVSRARWPRQNCRQHIAGLRSISARVSVSAKAISSSPRNLLDPVEAVEPGLPHGEAGGTCAAEFGRTRAVVQLAVHADVPSEHDRFLQRIQGSISRATCCGEHGSEPGPRRATSGRFGESTVQLEARSSDARVNPESSVVQTLVVDDVGFGHR